MRYVNILYDAVVASGYTYQQIVEKCRTKDLKISKSYLSKICSGHQPPKDHVNKVLAEILGEKSGITYQTLAIAKYKEMIPEDIYEAIASGQ